MSTDAVERGLGSRPLLRADLSRIAANLHVPAEVVEKDYVLSYILVGVAEVPQLRGLHFKGGTALKKMYFGSYRFSEDLDFSAVDVPRGADLDAVLAAATRAAANRLAERGKFEIELDRPPESRPHPGGQEAFRIRVAFPWQRTPMVRVKLEITYDEPVLLPASFRSVLHGYEELGERFDDVRLATYSLEEIVAEKLRALRQTQVRLETRGWARPRTRDYYDLWRLLRDKGRALDHQLIRQILPTKFAHRSVAFQTASDFFTSELLTDARRNWQGNLGPFVSELPDVEIVLPELRQFVEQLIVPA